MTDWEKQYQIGETPWDKGTSHPQLGEFPEGTFVGRWLVPGCGFGHDAAAMIRAGADAVVGMDIAPSAVEGAKIKWADVPSIQIEHGNLFDMSESPDAGQFDGVWEHTCFCAIDPSMRQQYVQSVAAALKPGGKFVACFYLTPWDEDEDQTQGPPFMTSREELDALFGGEFLLEQEFVPVVTFPGREGKELVRILRKIS
jgi:SAM-dependent methyltransferase